MALNKYKNMKAVLLIFCISILAFTLQAEEIYFEDGGFFMDIPEHWILAGMEHPRFVTFADITQTAIAQVMILKDKENLNAFFSAVSQALDLEAEYETYSFDGRDAAIGIHTIGLDNSYGEGWVFAAHQKDYSVYIATYAPADVSNQFIDDFLSIINSFSFDLGGLKQAGPVSTYFAQSDSSITEEAIPLTIGNSTLNYKFHAGQAEAAQNVVEWEARLMEALGAVPESFFIKAWNRYYRIIYRETRARIAPLSKELRFTIMEEGIARDEIPQYILSWLQNFTYYRAESFSDFLAAPSCLADRRGDCDSLGLIYIAILEAFGFDAILFVSPEYSHAVAGVVLDKPGASMEFNGKRYLVAELTANVNIGKIAQDQSDMTKWIPMDIRPTSTLEFQ